MPAPASRSPGSGGLGTRGEIRVVQRRLHPQGLDMLGGGVGADKSGSLTCGMEVNGEAAGVTVYGFWDAGEIVDEAFAAGGDQHGMVAQREGAGAPEQRVTPHDPDDPATLHDRGQGGIHAALASAQFVEDRGRLCCTATRASGA